MKEKGNIKSIHRLFPVLGLAVLLLLSPCKVRNYIQVEFDLPQTEITSKNQTTISNSNCSDIVVATASLAKGKSSFQQLAINTAAFNITSATPVSSNNYIQSHGTRAHLAPAVPLYILYQNFKDYL